MALKDTMMADIKSIITDMATPVFTYKGEEYDCVPSSDGKISNLELGGFSVDIDLVLTVLKEEFSDEIYPSPQENLTYNSVGYKIQSVRQDPLGAFIRLFCIDPSKGV